MRVGLISDTHGLLRATVFDQLAGVDVILHAGDIGDTVILDDLQAIAPVHAVFGNTDGWGIREVVQERVELELEGWRVLVTHGHELGSPTPRKLRDAYPEAQLIVYGHTHVPLLQELEGALIINPGAAGPARFKLVPSLAVLELAPGKRSVRHAQLV